MVLADTDAGTARIVLGGRFGEEDAALSVRRLERFRERGGRLVETAHSYAGGRAEEVVGRWLRRRPDMALVDKVGHPRDDATLDLSGPALRAEVTDSLRRLSLDRLDVVLLHRDDPRRPVADLVGTLVGLVAEGLACRVGVTNWAADRLGEALRLCIPALRPVLSYHLSLAVPIRPVWPGTRHADPEILDLARRHRLPLLSWAAHARGWFTADGDAPDERWAAFEHPTNRAARDRCRAAGRRLGVPPEAVALAWTLAQPGVWPVVGPATVAELDVTLDAAELALPPEVLGGLVAAS